MLLIPPVSITWSLQCLRSHSHGASHVSDLNLRFHWTQVVGFASVNHSMEYTSCTITFLWRRNYSFHTGCSTPSTANRQKLPPFIMCCKLQYLISISNSLNGFLICWQYYISNLLYQNPEITSYLHVPPSRKHKLMHHLTFMILHAWWNWPLHHKLPLQQAIHRHLIP